MKSAPLSGELAEAKRELELFMLRRIEDASEVSGVGNVAEGVVFSSGKAVLCWTTKHTSVAVYDSLEELMAIHGHDGKTLMYWIGREDD